MATSEAQEAIARERIVKHMNGDHQDSIRRYIEHASGISSYQLRGDTQMANIALDKMDLTFGDTQIAVPFDPPLKSLREARERLIQMDQSALKALGRSQISVTRYIPPHVHFFHLVNFSVCILTYAAFCRPSNFKPDSLLYDHLLYKTPAFAAFCLTIQPILLTIMAAIHMVEAGLMVKKMEKHSVLPFSGVWWCWVCSCFVEGVTSFKRLDELVDNRKKEKEAKSH
ncbi:integral membrane protein-like protein [Lindgomyces ingoldianus]|uniref:Integral membrane protein-like protein n=1 Tax=Lindgomyces ingoldianus TaxID=673940 RepID=A0ACB6QFN5_9PLEO|nr:integral membrane protein-like protein [Lindgomyces ingoldianus]KAF2464946.1 integral membrane protein-like protein [Lindgomyces ingoldianus]